MSTVVPWAACPDLPGRVRAAAAHGAASSVASVTRSCDVRFRVADTHVFSLRGNIALPGWVLFPAHCASEGVRVASWWRPGPVRMRRVAVTAWAWMWVSAWT